MFEQALTRDISFLFFRAPHSTVSLKIKKVKDNPKEVVVILAKHYLDWIELQRKDTNDEVYKMILNYVTMMNMYKNMVMAVRSGDSIMIERSYIDLLPIFEATGKKNYVEIVCGMVESLYGTVEEKTLHLVRMNWTFPLYTGRDRWHNLMAHKAIDDHVEGQQPWYGSLGTNPEKKEAFCEASIHVTFFKKALQFTNVQYFRNETTNT